MPTTTTQNARLFAPQINLVQDTSRLLIKLKSGEGYILPSGLTLGDVIRYDPAFVGYTLSKADTETNAEVVGVVESISGSEHTVVISGSIKYPAPRLSAINSGGGGGVDVLFLSSTVAGGLTGTVDVTDGTEKIVKPVLQLAPNSVYNAIVLNYVGYKTGNQAVSQEDTPLLPIGSIVFGLSTVAPGVNWINVNTDTMLLKTDYPELYSVYGTSGGNWQEKAVISGGTVDSGMIGDLFYQYDRTGTQVGFGYIVDIDTLTNSIILQKTPGTDLLTPGFTSFRYFNSGGGGIQQYDVSSTEIYKFTVPAVTGTFPVQSGTSLQPYVKAYEIVSVKVLETITLSGLTLSGNGAISGTLALGNITDLHTYVTTLKNRLDNAGIS